MPKINQNIRNIVWLHNKEGCMHRITTTQLEH